MNPQFAEAGFLEFRRVLKREFYAWVYGSYTNTLVSNDFRATYMMGGEL